MKISRTEADLETTFRKACAKYGGVARKLVSPGNSGVFDRFVIWDRGVTTYAELKHPDGTGRRSTLQLDEQRLLEEKGHLAMFIESEAQIALFIKRSLDRVRAAALSGDEP